MELTLFEQLALSGPCMALAVGLLTARDRLRKRSAGTRAAPPGRFRHDDDWHPHRDFWSDRR